MDTSALFSSLEPQYGTVTAPQEESAGDTGNDQGPSQQPGTPPMTNLINAIMRGAARVQGQEQAKKVATKQADANSKMSITMKPGEPGDPPFVTVKDAPADLLNGTQAADLKEAYDRPGRQVEAKIAAKGQQQATPAAAPPAVQPPTIPPADAAPPHPTDVVDQTLGFHLPRGADSDIAEKLKTSDGIRQLNYELGGTEEHAKITIGALAKGKITAAEIHDRVALYRERRYAQVHEEIQAPIDAAQRVADRRQAEADRRANEQRLLQNQSDAETKAANEEKLGWLRATDLSTIDPEKLEETAQASTNAPWTRNDLNRARLKQQQDVNKAFLDYTDTKKDTFALGSQPTWEAAKAAFGHPLTPQQDTIGKARWQAARAYALRKSQDEDLKQQHADDQHEMTMLRIKNASREKPTPLGRGDINLMDAAELTSIDPSAVKNYDGALEAKEGLLRKEIADHTEKYSKAQAQAKAIQGKPAGRKQFGDEEQLAGFRADQQAAHARIAAATSELQQIQAARAARRPQKNGRTVQPVTAPASAPAAAPAQPPNVPHRPVANGQYTPEVEAGIRKAMSDHHIGRQKVIQQLKASGYLQ